ncbi:MAG: bifunctional hydroxymethylpyrimidine kinase/phosphomethylpyrimidine kinase [Magnetococcales bacterium]|nr:bifunctional hydroxymethylpyrimidine kinase/phosphomethylpyrimidine kinase [Magnetococcales bacterium]
MGRARVLIVAGSDPVAGAGLQADLKTVTALGGHGMTVVTAITVQDTSAVTGVHPVPAELVAEQMRACLQDVGADCVKLGMLATGEIVAAVVGVLEGYPAIPVVADPVLAGTGGGTLLDARGREWFLRALVPRVALLTPNLPEAARLTGVAVDDLDGMREAASLLLDAGAGAVLIKGGHLPGEELIDLLVDRTGEKTFHASRLPGPGFHGTGCVLASAIATGLAMGRSMPEAVTEGRAHLRAAMTRARALGKGQWLLG